MDFLARKTKRNYIAEWKSSQIRWSHKPVREVRGCKSHFRNKCNINAQVQSAVKVGEESEVATNIQPYEI